MRRNCISLLISLRKYEIGLKYYLLYFDFNASNKKYIYIYMFVKLSRFSHNNGMEMLTQN